MSTNINTDTHTGASFSVRNRAGRALWGLCWILFFRFSPTYFHGWRAWLLRRFGAKVGRGVHVYPNVDIWAPWNLELADYCGVANRVGLYCQGRITIGRHTVISQGSQLVAGTHDYSQPGFPLVTKPICVGADAWIAAEAFIHAGVTIGQGCVVGARSVVTRDMPEWMVCAGHPCKPLKKREYAGFVAA